MGSALALLFGLLGIKKHQAPAGGLVSGKEGVMPLGNYKVEDRTDNVSLVSETLSDGSRVWQVRVKNSSSEAWIDCINEDAAVELFTMLSDESKFNFLINPERHARPCRGKEDDMKQRNLAKIDGSPTLVKLPIPCPICGGKELDSCGSRFACASCGKGAVLGTFQNEAYIDWSETARSDDPTIRVGGKYMLGRITGDTRRPGMPHDGFLVRYNRHDNFGWLSCRCFATLPEAEQFAANLEGGKE
jgi:hypothetical protein